MIAGDIAVAIPRRRLDWSAAARIVSGRLRPQAVFEGVARPEDMEAVLEILSAGRVRISAAELPAPAAGVSYVLAPFLTPRASRFSDGTFGVLYAASSAAVARAEAGFHLARFMAATAEPPQPLLLHLLRLAIRGGSFADVGTVAKRYPELLDPDPASYARPQAAGAALRAAGADGVRYPSVRAPKGTCAGVFRPRCVQRCQLVARLTVEWTGDALGEWWEVRPLA